MPYSYAPRKPTRAAGAHVRNALANRWINSGTFFAYLPSFRKNLYGGAPLTANGTVAYANSPYGVAPYLSSTSDYLSTPTAFPSTVTYEVLVYNDGSGSTFTSALIATREGGAHDREMNVYQGGSAQNAGFYVFPNVDLTAGNGSVPSGRTTHIVGMCDGTNQTIWINGRLANSQAQGSAPYTGYTSPDIRIGESANYGIFILKVQAWSRALTRTEISALALDPFQVFTESRRVYYLPVSASGVVNNPLIGRIVRPAKHNGSPIVSGAMQ